MPVNTSAIATRFKPLFDNRVSLFNAANPRLNHSVGVLVSSVRPNQGLGGCITEVEMSRPMLSCVSSVKYCEIGKINAGVTEYVDSTVSEIDMVIAELQAHKKRLLESRALIECGTVNLDTRAAHQQKMLWPQALMQTG